MPRNDCPDPEALRRYALALVTEDQAERLEAHLAECTVCENIISLIDDPSDPLLASLRFRREDEDVQSDPDFRSAVEKAKRILPIAPSGFETKADQLQQLTSCHPDQQKLFGPRLTALVAFTKGVCHVSFSTICKFLRDVV